MEETETIQAIVRQLSQETASLVRHHLALAKLELKEGFSRWGSSLLWLSAGVLFAAISLALASIGLAAMLGTLLGSLWLGFFAIAVFWAVLSIFLIADSVHALRSEKILPLTQQQLQLDRQTLLQGALVEQPSSLT